MKKVPAFFLIALHLLTSSAWALRQPEVVQSSGLEELRASFSSELEEPPFGHWLRTDHDRKRMLQIVREFKGRNYPGARKKGPREHGTKKTLIHLKQEGYYVRFYELGIRDYFVFRWEDPGNSPFVVWAQGQQVE